MTDIFNYEETDFASPELTEGVLCDRTRTSTDNLPLNTTFWKSGKTPKMTSWTGFARNGVALFNGLNS